MDNSDQSFRSLSTSYFLVDQLINEIKDENMANVISLLERKKVDWNVLLPEYGAAPMHFLAGRENEVFAVPLLKRALRNGGDPNVRTEDGLTPVHLAAMWGRCRVLEALLSCGGDPELMDWTECLTAEQHALKERQFQAYAVLSTYSVIANDVERFSKYLSNENSPEESPRSESDLNDEKTTSKNQAAQIDDTELLEGMDYLPINAKAAEMIKEHRRGTRLYEHPKSTSYKESWERVLSELPKRNAKESIYGNYNELDDHGFLPGTSNEKSLDDISDRKRDQRLQPIYEEIKSDYNLDDCTYGIPKKHNKHRSSSKCKEESELYLHGFEEVASYKTVDRRHHGPSRSSARSEESTRSEVHNRVLCKMSRIYLFMLKKRQIFQRAK